MMAKPFGVYFVLYHLSINFLVCYIKFISTKPRYWMARTCINNSLDHCFTTFTTGTAKLLFVVT